MDRLCVRLNMYLVYSHIQIASNNAAHKIQVFSLTVLILTVLNSVFAALVIFLLAISITYKTRVYFTFCVLLRVNIVEAVRCSIR